MPSGLRASELCQLKLRDLNLQVRCVRVLGKRDEGSASSRLGHAAKEGD